MTLFDAIAGHPEGHRGHRSGWLRAAVLGANDGLVSTSSLMVGVASALRVVLGGGAAMAVTELVGQLTGAVAA